jgi:hypothetical protein
MLSLLSVISFAAPVPPRPTIVEQPKRDGKTAPAKRLGSVTGRQLQIEQRVKIFPYTANLQQNLSVK